MTKRQMAVLTVLAAAMWTALVTLDPPFTANGIVPLPVDGPLPPLPPAIEIGGPIGSISHP